MNLGEIQEFAAQLERINQILTAIEDKTQNLEKAMPQTEEVVMTVQQGTRILYRFNHILAHLGLPENIDGAIRKLQQIVFMARMVEMSLVLLQQGTPYGMIFGALGFVSTYLSFNDLMGYDVQRGNY